MDIVRQRLTPMFKHHCTWSNLEGSALDKIPKAAVLVLLLEKDDQVYVLLTRRSSHIRSEPSTVAFPGGKFEESDADEIATALRESWEEVSLPANAVDVIGTLVPIVSRGGAFLVTPVVAILKNSDVELKVSSEVDAIFFLPLERFLSNINHRQTNFTLSTGDLFYVHFFVDLVNDQEFTTWGLTAYICILVAIVAFNAKSDFEFQPNFHYHGATSLSALMEETFLQRYDADLLNKLLLKSNL